MNNQTDNTQNTAEEFRQAVKRLGDGAAYVAREVPWVAIAKGTGKLAINILRYSMGLSIYGFIIWPYRFLVAPTCAVAAGLCREEPPRVIIVDDGVSDRNHWNDSYESSYRSTHAWESEEQSVNGNIYASVGEGSFHISDHDRLDTI